jgi:hypothetical protein
VYPDVYQRVELPMDLMARSRAAYLLVRDMGGVLGGYSAATLLGADCAPCDAPAEVILPGHAKAHPELLVRQGCPACHEIAEAFGCRVTTALRSAWDLVRRLPLVEGVVAVDALGRVGGFGAAELMVRGAASPGARGCRRVPEVCALVDTRAESPMETRLRVGLLLAGLPAPAVQYEIVDADSRVVIARVDLAYPAATLAIEYDGAWHFDRNQAERDRRRDNLLAAYGWQTVRFGRDDVGPALPRTAARISDLLTQRTHRPTPQRADRPRNRDQQDLRAEFP